MTTAPTTSGRHTHVFLANDNVAAERRTWAVIVLCGVTMLIEIGGGIAYGSIALVADGLHIITHAGVMLLAAIAYRYARSHAHDPRFSFGTGKVGDLAGFTSAVVLALFAVLIGYESISRLFTPEPIRFAEAIPIAVLGLVVNIASAWLLTRGGHHHHGHADHAHKTHHDHDHDDDKDHHRGHADGAHHDNNMRAAITHVLADAAVAVLVIVGLLLACAFGWLWMDPVAGLIGAGVIALWSFGLVRDSGAIMLDMVPDARLASQVREAVEANGDRVADLHLWRLGPGHTGAILSIETADPQREAAHYRTLLARFPSMSHVTIEVGRL